MTQFDPSQSFLGEPAPSMQAFFHPKSVAIIGATEKENSVGRTILLNLTQGEYKGDVYPINPKYESLGGVSCFGSIEACPDEVDLCIIITPAKTVPPLVKACVEKGVKAIIIISAGFKEMGEPGLKLEEEILGYIKGSDTRIIGPNCLGLMNPITKMNATFAADLALPGNIAFISQSGAMCTSVLDWSLRERVGFSSFVSIGSMADVDWGDLIEYFGKDEKTESILIYMETAGDARSFISAARQVSIAKPIILIKAGRTEAAAKAAASHTGSLAGSDEAFEAAVHRAGIMRVQSIEGLFDMAAALSKQPRPKGPNLTIITNAGGPGVLATDQAVCSGANITELDPKTIEALSEFLPDAWSHDNPVDILGDAGPEAYAKTLEVVAKDPNTDGMLVILTPQDMSDPTATAQALAKYSDLGKPVLASWMGGTQVAEGSKLLSEAGIPTFSYPDEACETFGRMWNHQKSVEALYETPEEHDIAKSQDISHIFEKARSEKRTLLTEFESKQVLDAYGIPTVETTIAETRRDSGDSADAMGYPVVVKLHSETITHKTDVGGVKLNLQSRKEVEEAYDQIEESVTRLHSREQFEGVTVQQMIKLDGYELILGAKVDEQFGPILLFGTGGQLVEVFKDRALSLPPLNGTLAHQMMHETKIFEALKGVRGRESIDLAKLEQILISFSDLISDHPWIAECDINPLLASPDHLIALDARIVLHEKESEIIRPAIRPYPKKMMKEIETKAGKVMIRPIKPEDERKLHKFHKELGETSVRQNYLRDLSFDERIAHSRMLQICAIDYDRDIRFVAEFDKAIVGVISLSRRVGTEEGVFNLVIVDRMHRQSLGSQMLDHLIEVSKKEGFKKVIGFVLSENEVLLKMAEKRGFTQKREGDIIKIVKTL